jgi:hypothetical protein
MKPQQSLVFESRRYNLIQAGQAHETLASTASFSVALQQLVISKHCQW